MRRLFIVVVLLALAGCSSPESGSAPEAKPDPLHSYNGRVIRGWLLSLERQDYAQAAYYFAPNALIDQGHPYRLKTRSEALQFNASLPCRADLIGMRGGGHAHHVLATFRLRRGPGGKCSGLTRVRYTIENGKFTAWRQLPDSAGPEV
jgi:hypothetical protein